MGALIDALLPYIIAGGAALAAIVMAYLRGRSSGKAAEQAKLAKEEQKARDVSDAVEDDLAGRDSTSKREELAKWAKR